jgi:hypothetical protein
VTIPHPALSQIHNNGPALHLASVAIHLGCVDHQTALVAPRSTHEPLPKNTFNTVVHDCGNVEPRFAREEVPDQAATRAGEQPLVCLLKLVEVNGLLSVAPVNVAEDVKARLRAPDLAKEVWTAKIIIEVVFLRIGGVSGNCFWTNGAGVTDWRAVSDENVCL